MCWQCLKKWWPIVWRCGSTLFGDVGIILCGMRCGDVMNWRCVGSLFGNGVAPCLVMWWLKVGRFWGSLCCDVVTLCLELLWLMIDDVVTHCLEAWCLWQCLKMLYTVATYWWRCVIVWRSGDSLFGDMVTHLQKRRNRGTNLHLIVQGRAKAEIKHLSEDYSKEKKNLSQSPNMLQKRRWM